MNEYCLCSLSSFVDGLEGNPMSKKALLTENILTCLIWFWETCFCKKKKQLTREKQSNWGDYVAASFAKRTTWLECMIIEPSCFECSVIATGLLVVFGGLANRSAAKLMETGLNDTWD